MENSNQKVALNIHKTVNFCVMPVIMSWHDVYRWKNSLQQLANMTKLPQEFHLSTQQY